VTLCYGRRHFSDTLVQRCMALVHTLGRGHAHAMPQIAFW
jgi:hypothetical protein